MKKTAIYIIIAILSIGFVSAKELLNFSIENRTSESGEYKADLIVDISGASWDVGPTTIVIKYNAQGLAKKAASVVSDVDSQLETAGYYVTQSAFSDGELAINIIASDQNVTKSSKFKICSLTWSISDGDKMDDLAYDSDESIVYNSLNLMTYNCTSSTCFKLTNPASQRIIPRMERPTLVSPSNTATKINLAIVFDWQSDSDATGYEFVLSDKSDFSTTLISTTTSSDLYALAKGTLNYNKTYYWKVRAYNTDEKSYWSNVWSFTTRSPLAKVTNLNPANLATSVKIYPKLSYSAVTDADSYLIYLSEQSDFSNLILNQEISALELNCPIKLNYAKKYYWKVKAKDHFGEEGEWSDISAFTTKNQLAVATLTTPANSITDADLKPTFSWSTISGAVGYRLQISKASDFSSLERDISGTATTHYLASNLESNIKYYWRVKSWDSDKDSSDYSSVWNFKTRTPLTKVVNLSPANNDANIKLYPKLSYSAVSGADSYLIQLSTVSNFSSFIINTEIAGLELTSASKLNYYSTYYWRVKAKNHYGDESPWSDVITFTTKNKLDTPVITTPANASNDNILKPEFKWNALTNAEGYLLQISKTNAFTTLERNITVSGISHTLTSNLELLTKYYWRIKAWDSDKDSSEYSSVWNFTTVDLSAPNLQTPVNNLAFVPVNTSFTWLAADNADAYKIQISKSASFSTIDFESTLTSISYTPPTNLTDGKKYYWRVLSKKGSVESSWSSMNQFSTDFDITLVKPTNNLTNVARKNIQFECQGVDVADSYVFQVATNTSFTSIVFEETSSSPTLTHSYLNRKTKYYWRVKPMVGTEYGDWSSTWNFTTEEFTGPNLSSPANSTIDWEPAFELKWVSNSEASKGYDIQISQNTSFVDIEYEILGNSTTSYTFTELDRGITYFWRVRSVNDYESSAWSAIWNFTTDIYDMPTEWSPIVTDNSHNVRIPLSINPKVVGRALRKGDVIGAFFKDGSQSKCCGYAVWNKVTANLLIYGDDPATTAKEGYVENELLEYKLFDCLTNTSYDPIVKYSSGPEVFTIDGSSVLSELKTEIIQQNLYLSKGWNTISSNINLYDNDIPDIWNGYSTNLVIMKNVNAKFYIPGKIDQLKKWDKNLGYLVYMSYADRLTLIGSNLLPDTVNISLTSGWSIVSYLRNSDMDPPTALATVTDNLVIAKDNTGKFYLPSTGTNTIGNLKSGLGYKLYMKNADVLTYPANSSGKRNTEIIAVNEPTRLIPRFAVSGSSAALIIYINAPDNSEIGIYNTIGVLVGSGVVESGSTAITIIGDNEMTDEIDGAENNEALSSKILLPDDTDPINLETQALTSLIDDAKYNTLVYSKDEVLSANAKISFGSVNDDELSIYPNPSEKNVFIDLKTDTKNVPAIIEIYTENGKLVSSSTENLDSNGNLFFEYKTANIAAGVYLVKIEYNQTIIKRKFLKK